MEYKGEPLEVSRWWKERCLYILLGYLGKPHSYLDVGCGDGYFVELMGKLTGNTGKVIGIDLTSSGPFVFVHDLRTPLNLNNKFDMVVSLEVGEHLPEEYADIYCDTLVRHTDQWLVFSAAQVGQSGWHHINCQPKEYWLGKLEMRGLKFNRVKTEEVAVAWSKFVPKDCQWAYHNLMILGEE